MLLVYLGIRAYHTNFLQSPQGLCITKACALIIVTAFLDLSRRLSTTESSVVPADVAHVKTPEVTEGNAVMYDEVGITHFMTTNEIQLTTNSAYNSTNIAKH